MTTEELIALRKATGLTQAEMASQIGLSLRAYNSIENGETKLRKLHVNAIERATLGWAVLADNPMLAPPTVRKLALDLARKITEG